MQPLFDGARFFFTPPFASDCIRTLPSCVRGDFFLSRSLDCCKCVNANINFRLLDAESRHVSREEAVGAYPPCLAEVGSELLFPILGEQGCSGLCTSANCCVLQV